MKKCDIKSVCRKVWKEFQKNDAIGIVEIILILVILIAIVALFKTNIDTMVSNAFKKIDANSKKVIK